jgi:hypothetical protein
MSITASHMGKAKFSPLAFGSMFVRSGAVAPTTRTSWMSSYHGVRRRPQRTITNRVEHFGCAGRQSIVVSPR